MHTTTTDHLLAELLEHSTWVRRLAGSLVRDDALADDLTQEAWLAALAHPPKEGLPVRPWLGQVMRNLVRMRFRGERRRQAREANAHAAEAREDAAPHSPEQLLARVETQRSLTALVVKLEEPLRSTVLLRYYEGLSAADIALQQAVPAGTVRWRLKSALDKLRAELDRTHGGSRQAWLPLIAPLAAGPHGAAPPGASLGVKAQEALSLKVWLPVVMLVSAGAAGILVAHHRAARQPGALSTAERPVPAVAAASTPPGPQHLSRAQRTELLARIERKQHAAGAASAPTPELDKEYIREQMQALMPLVKECYENTLRERPSLEGTLSVSFTIVAEPELGGLVADSKIEKEGSTIADEGMRECVQETMYGAKFPAPPGGGEVHVTYPFTFTVAP